MKTSKIWSARSKECCLRRLSEAAVQYMVSMRGPAPISTRNKTLEQHSVPASARPVGRGLAVPGLRPGRIRDSARRLRPADRACRGGAPRGPPRQGRSRAGRGDRAGAAARCVRHRVSRRPPSDGAGRGRPRHRRRLFRLHLPLQAGPSSGCPPVGTRMANPGPSVSGDGPP